jgi:hypothetical protein
LSVMNGLHRPCCCPNHLRPKNSHEKDNTFVSSRCPRRHLSIELPEPGRVLRSKVEHFEPRQISPRFRRHSDARYRIQLEVPPAVIARIEVRAHEGEHPRT